MTAEERAAGVTWKFRAGAPLPAPPALLPDGGVVFGTTEGYVHALLPDGSFNWSYTVAGAVTGSLAVANGGTTYAVTSSGLLYGLSPRGQLRFKSKLAVPPLTGLTLAGQTLVYGGRDGRAYAVAPAGFLLWRTAPEDDALVVGPRGASDGSAAFGTARTIVVRSRRGQRHVAFLDGAPARDPQPLAGGEWLVTTHQGAIALSAEASKRWTVPGAVFVAPRRGRGALVVTSSDELLWVSSDGAIEAKVSLPAVASGEPCELGTTVFVPAEAGTLLALASGSVRSIAVSTAAAVLPPICDATRHRVVAAAEDGTVFSVQD